jgi:hypothetical protein
MRLISSFIALFLSFPTWILHSIQLFSCMINPLKFGISCQYVKFRCYQDVEISVSYLYFGMLDLLPEASLGFRSILLQISFLNQSFLGL